MNCFALERVDAAKSGSVLPFDWYEMQEHVGWGVTPSKSTLYQCTYLVLHFYTFGRLAKRPYFAHMTGLL
jgi:hypothetical protein